MKLQFKTKKPLLVVTPLWTNIGIVLEGVNVHSSLATSHIAIGRHFKRPFCFPLLQWIERKQFERTNLQVRQRERTYFENRTKNVRQF